MTSEEYYNIAIQEYDVVNDAVTRCTLAARHVALLCYPVIRTFMKAICAAKYPSTEIYTVDGIDALYDMIVDVGVEFTINKDALYGAKSMAFDMLHPDIEHPYYETDKEDIINLLHNVKVHTYVWWKNWNTTTTTIQDLLHAAEGN